MCNFLRDIELINQVTLPIENYVGNIQLLCTWYFNLYALYFRRRCQLTVLTMGYVIPHHTKKL